MTRTTWLAGRGTHVHVRTGPALFAATFPPARTTRARGAGLGAVGDKTEISAWHGFWIIGVVEDGPHTMTEVMADTDRMSGQMVQKVVVVNGSAEVLGVLETALDAGRYDMVFVESSAHAYSSIRKVLPDLVILCTRVEALDGFQLLTMLKLDEATRNIPVLTYTTESEEGDFDAAISQMADDDEVNMLPAPPAPRMN